jgi:hypothetical protein
MLSKPPELAFQMELTEINREFLALATDVRVATASNLFGLAADILGPLRELTSGQLDAIAATPLLLAEFAPLPGPGTGLIEEVPPLPGNLSMAWRRDADGFANRLLTCIWQATRQDALLTAFCIGIDIERQQALAGLSFSHISQLAGRSLNGLRMRLAAHPSFWTDLIRSVRRGTDAQLTACRLAMIPLSLADAELPTRTQSCPRYF